MLKVASSKKVLCNLAWYCLACEYSPPHVGASASPDRSLCDSSPQKSILIISICPEFRHHLWMATLLCFLSLVWVKMAYSIVNSLLMFLSCISCGEPFGSLNSGQIDIISMFFFGLKSQTLLSGDPGGACIQRLGTVWLAWVTLIATFYYHCNSVVFCIMEVMSEFWTDWHHQQGCH